MNHEAKKWLIFLPKMKSLLGKFWGSKSNFCNNKWSASLKFDSKNHKFYILTKPMILNFKSKGGNSFILIRLKIILLAASFMYEISCQLYRQLAS